MARSPKTKTQAAPGPGAPPPKASITTAKGIWPADQVERRSVEALLAYPRNPRMHADAQIDQIVASMRHFGWTVPVLIDEDDMIIAGHGRVMAARKLGLAEVPVMVARGWSEDDKRAYVIADNQLTINSTWNEDLLKVELGDLAKAEFDLGLTGFDLSELDAFAGLQVPGGTTMVAEKAKTTIFLSVPSKRAVEARKVTADALKKAGISHNL